MLKMFSEISDGFGNSKNNKKPFSNNISQSKLHR